MNKNIKFLLVLTVVLASGFYLYNLSSNKKLSDNKDAMMKDAPVEEKMENDKDPSSTSMMKNDSKYVEYSKSVFADSANAKRVLFFYANWCSTCRPADADFNNNISQIPEDLTLIRVNYNDTEIDQDEKDLAKKYNVTYQHTFVQIDEEGKVVARWNGGQTSELLENVK